MTDFQVPFALFLSFAFGAVVGLERQWHHKTAGLKTVTLVAVGSTAFGLISLHIFGHSSNPGQVASGVVTGIGFIGAGVIIHRGGSVQGINSAATLWATSSMGLAIGCGYLILGWSLFLVLMAGQFLLRWVGNYIDRRSGMLRSGVTYQLRIAYAQPASPSVEKAWSSFVSQSGVSILSCTRKLSEENEAQLEASLCLSELRSKGLDGLGQMLGSIPNVSRTEWQARGSGGGD